jgi:hypothetical protein
VVFDIAIIKGQVVDGAGNPGSARIAIIIILMNDSFIYPKNNRVLYKIRFQDLPVRANGA